MKKIKYGFVALFLAVPLLAASPVAVSAQTAFGNACSNRSLKDSTICTQTTDAEKQTNTFIQNVISVLLFAVGTISIIMIVVGGLRYVLSDGDSNRITNAKNTILYAVVGLVVSLLAYAIVNFVVGKF